MKKLLLLLICALTFIPGCTKKEEPTIKTSSSNTTVLDTSMDSYFIEGTLENHAFLGTQRVNYVNKEQVELKELYFHLYPNIYQSEKMFEDAMMDTQFPDGFCKGGIEIYEVSLLGMPLKTEITDRHIKINLYTPLQPGQSLIITFKYKTTLPKGHTRMGYYGNSFNLTGFYPVAAVYDNGWRIDDYNNNGDPFFTDVSDYFITINVPESFNVASSGEYTTHLSGSTKTCRILAEDVREAAIVADTDLKLYEDMVDGITVKSYAKNDTYGHHTLEIAKEALSFYNSTFGRYPYSQLSVVESSMHGGGMEYPNLVLISEEFYKDSEKINLEWIIAHEIAHQWWYGLVGSDPIGDPFMDESLTEFSTLLYTRSKYDNEQYEKLKNHFCLEPYASYKHILEDTVIHKDIMKYETAFELSMLAYNKGCMMYIDMENIMGEEKLKKTLQSYYNNYRYSIVSDEQWKEHIKSAHDYDWDSFFKKWLYS